MNHDTLSFVGRLQLDTRFKRVVAVGIAAGAATGAVVPTLRRDEDDGITGGIPIVCRGVKAVVTSAARFDTATHSEHLYVETFEHSDVYEGRLRSTFFGPQVSQAPSSNEGEQR